ncbi:MAG: ATP-binding cassette domain-containing protein [Candidatus Symbiothrix sp.]|jgi:lipopolysaccharide transport system ATP-binding protein|nr:ATP-binding cassette domain-containing protein [Candidatus Symbiothrix sp.]
MSRIAIKFENISKQYRLGLVSTQTLSHDLNRWWQTAVLRKEDPYLAVGETNDRSQKGNSDYVWALHNIDFEVREGDVLGIIGKNGAGKSTLLKILSRVTTPTTGCIRAKGRIASLLEVGTGFHPELTGRENIYMNGSIMGMTKREIAAKLDEIVDFAGVARYLDTPTKRYSSGMTVRLGFSIAAHLEPEILVVDEVLAVGDTEFQQKAIGKMQDVSKGEGRTVLFVSHNMGSMQQLCTKGILLGNGMVEYSGSISDTIQQYQHNLQTRRSFDGKDGDENAILLQNAKLESSSGKIFYNSSSIHISFEVSINKHCRSLVIGFNIYGKFGYPVMRVDYNDYNDLTSLDLGLYRFDFEFPPFLFSTGGYNIVFDVAEANVKRYTSEKSNLYFEVITDENCRCNAYNENSREKSSIIRGKWLTNFEKIK